MKANNTSYIMVCDENGECAGVLTATELLYRISKHKIKLEDPVFKITNKKFRRLGPDMPLNELNRVLARAPYAIIKDSSSGKPRLVTSADMVHFITKGSSAPAKQEEKNTEEKKTEEQKDNSGTYMKVAAVLAMGIGAAAYFMKKKN